MNVIMLTAEQAAQVRAGVREFVIEGEPKITPDSVGAAFFAVLDHGKGAGLPHLFVTPKQWADADGPCETCKGLGCTCPGYCERADDHVCPDCLDGRKRVELRENCWVNHVVRHWRSHDGTALLTAWCPGFIPVAWATVEVKPHDNGHFFVAVLSDVELA